MSARAIAYRVLLQVERADAYLNVALDAALKAAGGTLARQDAALATELTYGVVRRALALDAALAPFSSRPLRKLETGVHVALRLGAYQLLFLDRVPVHATVDETVKLVKEHGLARASGFVNAVLRRVAEKRTVPLPDDPLERISVQESHPLWLVRRWAARLGESEAAALCHADNQAPAVCVRVNTTRATRDEALAALAQEGIAARPAPLSPLGIVLDDAGPLASLDSFRRGLYQVQDEAAQLVSLMSQARPGMRVLDACAAPGGKCCHVAEQLRGEGEVVAVDLHARKLEKLQAEAARLGVDKLVRLRAADASRALPLPKKSFDLILLDAPCSGLGTLRRHPELRYRRAEADVARLAALQEDLISNVLEYLAPDGRLVFAVCSTEPEEGAGHLEKLRARGLSVERPEAGADWAKILEPDGTLATWPHRQGTDGFFGVRLVGR